MQLANQLELCLHKHTQIVASAACRVGSQEFHSWIASLPLVSLLFIVIPTPFLNFLNFIFKYTTMSKRTSREQGLITKKCVAMHINLFLIFIMALYSSVLVKETF